MEWRMRETRQRRRKRERAAARCVYRPSGQVGRVLEESDKGTAQDCVVCGRTFEASCAESPIGEGIPVSEQVAADLIECGHDVEMVRWAQEIGARFLPSRGTFLYTEVL